MIRYQLVRIMKKFFYPKEVVDDLLTDKESIEIQKSQIVDFPASLPMQVHQHTKNEITDFPTTMTPSSHTHGNISNEGVITGKQNKNVVTDSNGKITTEDKYSHPTHAATTGVPASNVNLTFGGSFQVSQPVVNNLGHVTQLNARTLAMPSLPVASNSQAGVIKIGSDSNSAAAGNHSHNASNVLFTPTVEEWQGLGNPSNVGLALNKSFEYVSNQLDEKQSTLEISHETKVGQLVPTAKIHFTKYGKLVIADFYFKHSAGTDSHLVNISNDYIPSSYYHNAHFPSVQLADKDTGYLNVVFIKYNDPFYQIRLVSDHPNKSQTVHGQLVWVTD